MASTPAVPDISQQGQATQQPQTSGPSLDTLLGTVAQQASAPLPSMYSQGTAIAQPRVQPIQPFTPANTNNRPITDQATSIKEARRKDAFAEIGNLIGRAGQNIQQKKQDLLKDDLKTVMTAKQNVANAQIVLQQDPNNKIAQGVLAANKKQLDAILSDPKKQKMLAKALDISFTDPEKNKTPEVQAYQQAAKEVVSAGAFNSDNPAEHAIAQLAAGGTAPSPKPQAAAPQQQPQQSQQHQPRSATPYADKALAKDLPTIEVNPQYQMALQQRAAAQKVLFEKVLPAKLQQETQLITQQIKAKDANSLALVRGALTYQQHQLDAQSKLQLENTRDRAAAARVAMQNANRIAVANIHAAAIQKIAESNNLTKEQIAQVKNQGATAIDKQIKTVSDTLKNYGALANDISNNSALTKDQKEDQLKLLNARRTADMHMLDEYQKIRAKNYPDSPVAPQLVPTPETTQQSILGKAFDAMSRALIPLPQKAEEGASDAGRTSQSDKRSSDALKAAEVQFVGEDNSDEYGSDDDRDEDSTEPR